MKVLDTSFLIDYLDKREEPREFYEKHGGEQIRWVIPTPALAEVLVGEGNFPDGDVETAREKLSWADMYPTDEQTAVTAGKIADEITPDGPYLDGPDGMIAAIGRELDAPVVAGDGDFTHDRTKEVIPVEEYK